MQKLPIIYVNQSATKACQIMLHLPVVNVPCEHRDVCSYTVDAGGVTWGYRKSTPAKEAADATKREVLLLHGLGSSSYSYR